MNTIWFDMDGTIYELYKILGWLYMLCNRDWKVFSIGKARKHADRINAAIEALSLQGWKVGVITWAPKGIRREDPAFSEVMYTKFEWLCKNFPALANGHFACLEYGESKADYVCVNEVFGEINYLIDDNKAVRKDWRDHSSDRKFKTINAARSFVRELESMTGGI